MVVLQSIIRLRQQAMGTPLASTQSSCVHLQGAAAVPDQHCALEGAHSGCGLGSADPQA